MKLFLKLQSSLRVSSESLTPTILNKTSPECGAKLDGGGIGFPFVIPELDLLQLGLEPLSQKKKIYRDLASFYISSSSA